MTKARQDATIRKIERNVGKHIPEINDADFLVDGYEDEMGENIQDLESKEEGEEEGEGNQRAESNEENQLGEGEQEKQNEESRA